MHLAQFWSKMFGSDEDRPSENPFDEMPIYHIEVTSRRGDAFWNILQGFAKEDWITLELATNGQFPVDVYGGILWRRQSKLSCCQLPRQMPPKAQRSLTPSTSTSGPTPLRPRSIESSPAAELPIPLLPMTSVRAPRSDFLTLAKTYGFSSISAVAATGIQRLEPTRCASVGVRKHP